MCVGMASKQATQADMQASEKGLCLHHRGDEFTLLTQDMKQLAGNFVFLHVATR